MRRGNEAGAVKIVRFKNSWKTTEEREKSVKIRKGNDKKKGRKGRTL
jgi:hypothetical protein